MSGRRCFRCLPEGEIDCRWCAVGQITDIALQPGEQLVGSSPVAAGDTVR